MEILIALLISIGIIPASQADTVANEELKELIEENAKLQDILKDDSDKDSLINGSTNWDDIF